MKTEAGRTAAAFSGLPPGAIGGIMGDARPRLPTTTVSALVPRDGGELDGVAPQCLK
jgi:hypothetical protein